MEFALDPPIALDNLATSPPTPVRGWPYYACIDLVTAKELAKDAQEVILLPQIYDRKGDPEDTYWQEDEVSERCWKSTIIYQQVAPHPRLVPFVRADEWTGFPVLSKPTGPPLNAFLKQHCEPLYEERSEGNSNQRTAASRVRSRYLPLVYQWALQLANALKHIHSYSAAPLHLVYGDPKIANCWLSAPSLSLSLFGFLNASFKSPSHGGRHTGYPSTSRPFYPEVEEQTIQTDLFLYACVLYELMTGNWPGENQGLSNSLQSILIKCQAWPALEPEFLGKVARRCWNAEIRSAEQLMKELQSAVTGLGWSIVNDDELEGFDANALFEKHDHVVNAAEQ